MGRMREALRFMGCLLALLALPGESLAQDVSPDPLVSQADEYREAGRCEEAIALLHHARGLTEAALAGRLGLCEQALGREAEAAAHLTGALRAIEDPWVAANRDALVAALMATRPSDESAELSAGPTALATDAAPAPDAPAGGASDPDYSMDVAPTAQRTAPDPLQSPQRPRPEYDLPSEFGRNFRRQPDDDFPLLRRGELYRPEARMVRFSLWFGGIGFRDHSDLRSYPIEPSSQGAFSDSRDLYTSSWWFGGDVDMVWPLSASMDLVAGVSFGATTKNAHFARYAVAGPAPSSSAFVVRHPVERVLGISAFGNVRMFLGESRAYMALGVEMGLQLTDYGTHLIGGNCSTYGTCRRGMSGGMILQGTGDLGMTFNDDYPIDVFVRCGMGSPFLDITLHVAIPFKVQEVSR